MANKELNLKDNLKFIAALFIGVAALGFGSPEAQAVDLTNRLGVGYKNQFSENLPSLAAQYYPSESLGLSAALGVDTESDNSKFGLMLKVYRIVFTERQMNFYMGAGAGLLSIETAGNSESGFEINGFVGAEFFFAGLESLGFTFETGVSIVSISSGTRFRSFGDSPLRAGMIFYF